MWMSIIGRYACFPHGWPGHWDSCQHRRQRRSMNFGSGQAVVFLLHCRSAAPAAGPAGVPAAAEGVCIGSVSDRRDLSHPVRRRGTCTPDGACAWISDHTLRLPGGWQDAMWIATARRFCSRCRAEPAHCKGSSGTAAGRTSGATEAFYWDAFGRRAGQRQDDASASDRTNWPGCSGGACVVDNLRDLSRRVDSGEDAAAGSAVRHLRNGCADGTAHAFAAGYFAGRAGTLAGNCSAGTGALQRAGLCLQASMPQA